MKIALIAPPWTQLPTKDYTGIEIVISNIAEKFHEMGHSVTLFAPHGSKSSGKLVKYPKDITGINWSDADANLRYFYKDILAKYASEKSANLKADIIHNFTLSGDFKIPTLYTVYGPATNTYAEICKQILKKKSNYLNTVSNSQRIFYNEISPELNFIDNVYKAINIDNLLWEKEKEDYFLFLCHKEQQRSLDLARRVANAANKRLVAVVQGKKEQVFNDEIDPWLHAKTSNLNLQFTEDMPTEARYKLYRKAKGTFYISQWKEPFGMEMLESLASGTPVIALRKGAATEVIEHGKTGFIVETEDEMIDAVNNIESLKPEDCRNSVEEKFSSVKIAEKYLNIYQKIISKA
jgi:glycosyltransferase involved in cell wall biosynthesis